MRLDDCVLVPKDVLARHVGEEAVILHLATGTYYSLDAIGARIWPLLEQGKTLAEVCTVISDEYEVPADELERDVLDLVGTLASHGLVVLP
jgi:hypothetical protein